jgi:hypothetical protein
MKTPTPYQIAKKLCRHVDLPEQKMILSVIKTLRDHDVKVTEKVVLKCVSIIKNAVEKSLRPVP